VAVTVARLQAVLGADTRGFDTAMDKSQTRMGKVGKAAGIAGAAIAGGIVVGMTKSVNAAKEAQVAQLSLEGALKSANISYKAHGKAIDDAIQKTSKLAALDDEDLSEAFAKLVRTTKDVKSATEGMSLAANIARARHISLQAATKSVERAYNDSDTALKRYGVSVPKVTTASDQLKHRIDDLRDSLKKADGPQKAAIEAQIEQAKGSLNAAKAIDKHATAQNSIAAAQKQFAGAAEQYGKSGAAAQERFQVAVENLEESLGKALLPALTAVMGAVTKLTTFFTEHTTIAKGVIAVLGGIAALLLTVSAYTKIATAAQILFNSALFANPIGLVVLALGALVTAFILAYKNSETFRNIVQAALKAVKTAFDAVQDAFEWLRDHSGAILDVLSKHPAWLAIKLAIKALDTAWDGVKLAFAWIRDNAGTIVDVLSNHPAWLAIKLAIDHTGDAIQALKDAFIWIREKAGDAIGIAAKAMTKPLDAIKDAFNDVAKVVEKIVDAIKWLADHAGDILGKLGAVLGKIPGIGGLIGDARNPNLGLPGALAAVTGGEATISPALWPELSAARAMGLVLTSGYRPGAVTKHGTPSDHGQFPSKAIDVAGSAGAMAAFFMSLIGNPSVKQAFYDPLGSIFGGIRAAYREGGHSDHVHVATYDKGGWLRPGWNLAYNGTGGPEAVGGAPMVVNLSVGAERIAQVLIDPLRRTARIFEQRNGRSAF